jgi:DNA mismatch repair protein MutS
MLQQYFEVRRTLPKDTLLLFRLGDFYELFFDDAIDASRLLGLTLTKRGEHPMAGLPFHAADTYVNKLLAAGRKVAICDQAEPAVAGKLVRRALTRILSPGTTLDAKQLDASRNHYLAALHADRAGLHAAWLDLSTGDFRLASDPRPEDLLPVLTALDPRELVLPEGLLEKWRSAPHEQTALHSLAAFAAGRTLTELPSFQFEPATGLRAVLSTLGVLNLEGFGIPQDHAALGPAGALVLYVTENLCAKPENLHRLQLHRSAATLLLPLLPCVVRAALRAAAASSRKRAPCSAAATASSRGEVGRSPSQSGSRKSVSVWWLPTNTSVCGNTSSRNASR